MGGILLQTEWLAKQGYQGRKGRSKENKGNSSHGATIGAKSVLKVRVKDP